MKMIAITILASIAGFLIGVGLSKGKIQYLHRQVKELRAGKIPESMFKSVTRFIFVTTQVFALLWISTSYGIAVYSTVVLMQPFPVTELSSQAIITLLGVAGMKVVENIFEHNEGVVFGKTKQENLPSGDEEGVG